MVTVMDRLDVISVQSDASSIADSVASSYPGGNMQRLDEVGTIRRLPSLPRFLNHL